MLKTLLFLGLICLLAVLIMLDFVLVIPKFGSEHFGAPEDIKESLSKMPDRPLWVNLLGVVFMVLIFVCAIAVLVWAVVDAKTSGFQFWQVFLRFFIILEGYKLFDIVCFDWFMLTKLNVWIQKLYPETAGAKGFHSFGFNWKSQSIKIVLFAVLSLLIAGAVTLV